MYEIAEINIARMKGVSIDDPIMLEFVENIAAVNAVAEQSEGFVWRLKDDENNNATALNPYNDEQIIINISVWATIETLENYVYKSFHTDFLKRRKEWFQTYGKVHTAMWWIEKGNYPTVEEAVQKLTELQENGASPAVFDFRRKFPSPDVIN